MANLLTFVRFHHHLRAFTRVKVTRNPRKLGARAFYLDICDALDRKSEAEQPSQVFSFSGLLKLVRDVRFAPIAAKMLQCRE
jgi:hypothetical protein